jgi:hypothetical protein
VAVRDTKRWRKLKQNNWRFRVFSLPGVVRNLKPTQK